MPRCYLIALRLPQLGMLGLGGLTPIGTLIDNSRRDFVDVLPHIEMVAKRSYHKIQSQMADPVTMANQFHHFVRANKQEQMRYGDKLIGFFPLTPPGRLVGKSQTDNRVHETEAYLVYEVEDNHVLD